MCKIVFFFFSFKPIVPYKVLVAVAVVVRTLRNHDGNGKGSVKKQ